MANLVYNKFKEQTIRGNINLLSDTINVALIEDSYTPDADDDAFFVAASGNETTGSGYTVGGKTLTGKAIIEEDLNDRAVFTADNVTWSGSTLTARYAVLYDVTLGGTDDLIALIDFGDNKSTNNGDFIIQWDTQGILTLT